LVYPDYAASCIVSPELRVGLAASHM